MRWAWVAMVACYAPVKLASSDATGDTAPLPDLGSNCSGHMVAYCFAANEPTTVVSGDVDTDSDPDCRPGITSNANLPVCVLHGDTVEVTEPVFAHGSRALALFGRTTVSIAAAINVDSVSGRVGPGASTGAACSAAVSSGGAGGPGGSFGSQGGAGGASSGGKVAAMPAAPLGQLTLFGGGCAGGMSDGTLGGASGGALYVYAGTDITIVGDVLAGGDGGDSSLAGGGGGGTGGVIVLDSDGAIAVDALVQAHGGGAGGGGDGTSAGGAGMAASNTGVGGIGVGGGGSGGAGAIDGAGVAGDNGVGSMTGGGGGGGGDGFILTHGSVTVGSGGAIGPAPEAF